MNESLHAFALAKINWKRVIRVALLVFLLLTIPYFIQQILEQFLRGNTRIEGFPIFAAWLNTFVLSPFLVVLSFPVRALGVDLVGPCSGLGPCFLTPFGITLVALPYIIVTTLVSVLIAHVIVYLRARWWWTVVGWVGATVLLAVTYHLLFPQQWIASCIEEKRKWDGHDGWWHFSWIHPMHDIGYNKTKTNEYIRSEFGADRVVFFSTYMENSKQNSAAYVHFANAEEPFQKVCQGEKVLSSFFGRPNAVSEAEIQRTLDFQKKQEEWDRTH